MSKRAPSLFFFVLLVVLSLPSAAFCLTISGHLTLNGVPYSQALVFANNGLPVTATDHNGLYTFNVSGPGTYTVSPFPRRAYLPQPLFQTVSVTSADVTSVDFQLITPDPSQAIIAGRISTPPGWLPLEGVTLRATGGVSTTTDPNGIFYMTLPKTGRYFIFPSLDRNTFYPAYGEFRIRAGFKYFANFRALPERQTDSYPTYFTGLYDINSAITNSTCPFSVSPLSGVVMLFQNRQLVFTRLQRYGVLRGLVSGDSFSTHIFANRFYCSMSGDVLTTFSNPDSAQLSGSMNVNCFNSSPCTFSITGSLHRTL